MKTQQEQSEQAKVKVCLNCVLEGKHADTWLALQASLESIQLDLFDHVGPATILRYALSLASKKMEGENADNKRSD